MGIKYNFITWLQEPLWFQMKRFMYCTFLLSRVGRFKGLPF